MPQRQPHFGLSTRFALGFVQGIMGLFAGGAVIYEAHSLFLQYYANEWIGIQYSGVNGCAGEETIANGDIIGGKTICNQPENFMPWIEVYRHHPLAAAAYYGAAIAILLAIAFVWRWSQKRRTPDPTAQHPHGNSSDEGII